MRKYIFTFFIALLSFAGFAQFTPVGNSVRLNPDPPTEFVYGSTITKLPRTQYHFSFGWGGPQRLYAPLILHQASTGNTIVTGMYPQNSTLQSSAIAFQYNENNGVGGMYVVDGNVSVSDGHTIPSLGYSTVNSKWYIFHEKQPHSTVWNLYRSTQANDITGGWDGPIETPGSVFPGTTFEGAYAMLIDLPAGNAALWYRESDSYRAAMMFSDTGYEGWNTARYISNGAASGRFYESMPRNFKANNRYTLQISNRQEAIGAGVNWNMQSVVNTDDFITWYNQDRSFSKNVVSVGPLTETELINNCSYINIANTLQSYIPVSAMSPQGTFYAINGDGAGNHVFVTWTTGGTKSIKTITIPNLADASTVQSAVLQISAAMELVAWSDSKIDAVFRVDNGTTKRPHLYRTYDQGTTWVFLEDLFSTVNENFFYANFPANIQSIPLNRNTLLIGSTVIGANTDSDIYLRKVAYGAIQTETPTTPTAITYPTDITGSKFMFDFKSGKITVNGSNQITAITDQSGNATGSTVVGLPAWSTTDYVTFNGTSQRIDVTTTGLTAISSGTVVATVRKKLTQTTTTAANPFVWSDNTAVNRFGILGINNNAGFNNSMQYFYRPGATPLSSNSLVYNGNVDLRSNTDFHVLTWIVENNKQVRFYIDGIHQGSNAGSGLFLNSSNGSAEELKGKFISDLATNRITIAGLVQTTTSYSDFDLKFISLWDRVLNETEIVQLYNNLK